MSFVAPFLLHSARETGGQELVDTGRTARTLGQLDLTAWRESATPPCVKAARRSPKPEREKKVLCVDLYPVLFIRENGEVCAFIGCYMHSLWLRCPPGRSGQWKRTGLRQESASSPRSFVEKLPPEYLRVSTSLSDSLRAGFISSPSIYFWIIFSEKNLEVDFWIGGESRVRLFTSV